MSRTQLNRLFALGLLTALVVSACSGQDDAEDAQSTTTTAVQASSTTPTSEATTTSQAVTETSAGSAGDIEMACPGLIPGQTQLQLDVQGVVYQARVHVPESYLGAPDASAPVVINWHGLGSDGFQQATYSGYETLAETEGFLTVHPTGPPIPGSDQNAWDLALLTADQMADLGADPGDRDDVAMAGELIDTLVADWCVDPDRVYSTGLSNGGFFTGRLICEMGDRIAAAVVVAGLTHPDDCEPASAVPLLAYHGTDDAIVPYEGGGTRDIPPQAPPEVAALFDQTIAGEFAQFADSFDCATDPVTENRTDEVTAYRYEGCDSDRFAITLFEIAGGGHTWPGSPLGLVLGPLLGETTYDVDATVDGWAYMREFTR